MLDAIEQGRDARMAGRPPTDNPYPWAKRALCLEWVWGYTTAGTDLARAQARNGDQLTSPPVE